MTATDGEYDTAPMKTSSKAGKAGPNAPFTHSTTFSNDLKLAWSLKGCSRISPTPRSFASIKSPTCASLKR